MKNLETKSQKEMIELFRDPKMIAEIPYISFPKKWKVKMIPPFGGAAVRFLVQVTNNPEKVISVYLDLNTVLGSMNEPYWEVYPSADGYPVRHSMHDTKGLLKTIKESINEYHSKEN